MQCEIEWIGNFLLVTLMLFDAKQPIRLKRIWWKVIAASLKVGSKSRAIAIGKAQVQSSGDKSTQNLLACEESSLLTSRW